MPSNDQRLQGTLPKMDKLSPCVHLYRPSSAAARSSQPQSTRIAAPKLILLATWMSARDEHISKYFAKYQELYPSAQILLVKTGPALFFSPDKVYRELQCCVPVIRLALDTKAAVGTETPGAKPKLLAHLLSNGGSIVLENLYRAYRAQVEADATTKESPLLPPHVKIFDSAPGEFGLKLGVTAMTAGVRGWARWFLVPVMYLVVVWYWLSFALLGRDNSLDRTFAAHNDRIAGGQREVRRVYIYGDKDKLCDHRSVVKHAVQAGNRGFNVRRELFKGSPHVSHMRTDPERYSSIITETWEGTREER